jgi:hypothetical protein
VQFWQHLIKTSSGYFWIRGWCNNMIKFPSCMLLLVGARSKFDTFFYFLFINWFRFKTRIDRRYLIAANWLFISYIHFSTFEWLSIYLCMAHNATANPAKFLFYNCFFMKKYQNSIFHDKRPYPLTPPKGSRLLNE